MTKKKTAQGGKAEAQGADYESRAGAWYCVRLLMGPAGDPLFNLPATTTLTAISCQTGAAVDDVNVTTSVGGAIYGQAKRSVHLSAEPTSALVKAFDQFVRQYKECEDSVSAFSPRPLDVAKDRLVLITRRHNKKIYEILPRLLRGLRDKPMAMSLTQVNTSGAELEVATVIDQIIVHRWTAAYGVAPTPSQVGALLRLIWVQTLDVQDGETDETTARDMLRTGVLADATKASLAFSTLVKECARFRADGSGGNAFTLRTALSTAGISLRAAPDFQNDIANLNKWTDKRLLRAKRYIRLIEDNAKTTIKRDVLKQLRAAAIKDDIVLVGDPGSGKTGLAYDLAAHARSKGHDVVFIPVEVLNPHTLSDVSRDLEITHPLDEVLANWPGTKQGLLIVDALDAARSLDAQNILKDVIEGLLNRTQRRWNVIVSIRRYDLRQGRDWSRLFRGRPPAPGDIDPEFGSVKHILARSLSDEEIEQTSRSLPDLLKLFKAASPALKQLLRNIFNLHLLADLLALGVKKATLSELNTQAELLAAYWDVRIHGDDRKHDKREQALKTVLDAMTAGRSLQAPRDKVLERADSDAIVQLEQADILRQEDLPGSGIPAGALFFTHHILFDYAVARLIFKRGHAPDETAQFLTVNPHAAVMLSPSLTMAMNDAWAAGGDRTDFWNLALKLADAAGLPAVAQLTAPSVAAELAATIDDFAPLFASLRSASNAAAIGFVGKLMGALFVKRNHAEPLLGPDAGPWMDLTAQLSTFKSDWAMLAVRSLLGVTYETVANMTTEQKHSAGQAARNLLAYGFAKTPRFRNFVDIGLVATAETIATDVSASAALIRKSLEQPHLAEFGHQEMPNLARHIKAIAKSAPDLMVEVFGAVYGFAEDSDAKTNMGNSAILPLSSNKRQDYQMAWFGLSEAVPELLRINVVPTTEAVTRAVDAYNAREHKGAGFQKPLAKTFKIAPKQRLQFREDNSHVWYRGGFRSPTDAPALIVKFDAFLATLHNAKNAAKQIKLLIAAVGKNGGPAVLWASILNLAANQPRDFAQAVLPIALAPQSMLSFDTRHAVGRYIEASYALLTHAQRRRLESAILHLKGPLAHRSKEILGNSIPEQLIETQEMRDFLTAARATKGALAKNAPPYTITSEVRPFDTDDLLSHIGVDPVKPANAALRAAERAVQALLVENNGRGIRRASIEEHLPVLEALRTAISRARKDGAEEKAIWHAEELLAESTIPLTHADAAEFDTALRDRVADIFLFTADSANPVFDAAQELKDNASRAWGTSARGYSARGLMNLARSDLPQSATLDAAIRKLARDQVGRVRFFFVEKLPLAFQRDPNWVWQEIENTVRNDTAEGNVCAALNALAQIGYADPAKAVAIADLVLARFDPSDDDDMGERASSFAVILIAELALRLGSAEAARRFDQILADIGRYSKVLGHLSARSSDALVKGDPDNGTDPEHAFRLRGIGFYRQLTVAALAEMAKIAVGRPITQSGTWPDADQGAYRNMLMIVDDVALRLTHVVGGGHNNVGDEPTAVQVRLYREVEPIVDQLTRIGFPQITHHLVQYLERFIPVDPAGAFSRIAQTVIGAEVLGYAVESLAATLIVKIVNTYLADHRDIFTDPKRLDELVRLLDSFVNAGWPQAFDLTFRLTEIWR